MYENWIEDWKEKHKFARDYSILTGSFFNTEMAQKMINLDNPNYKSTESDFEESTRIVEESIENNKQKRVHRRSVIK